MNKRRILIPLSAVGLSLMAAAPFNGLHMVVGKFFHNQRLEEAK